MERLGTVVAGLGLPSETTTLFRPLESDEGSVKLAATLPSDLTVPVPAAKFAAGIDVPPTVTDIDAPAVKPVPKTVTPVPAAAVVGYMAATR